MKPIFSAPIDTLVFTPSLAVFALMGWLNQEGYLIPRYSGRFNRKEEARVTLISESPLLPPFYTWIDLSEGGRLRLEFERARIESALAEIGVQADRMFAPQEVDMAIDAAYRFIDTYFITPWGELYLGSKT